MATVSSGRESKEIEDRAAEVRWQIIIGAWHKHVGEKPGLAAGIAQRQLGDIGGGMGLLRQPVGEPVSLVRKGAPQASSASSQGKVESRWAPFSAISTCSSSFTPSLPSSAPI